jgi:hypothetical protein
MSCRLDFDVLGLPWHNLSVLSDHFIEQEVWSIISSLPPNKAPGPDGFMIRFL